MYSVKAIGQRLDGLAVLGGAMDDLVVDVRDVSDEDHLVAAVLQVTAHDIERDLGARMTDVAEVINRIAANIHAHDTRLVRVERFLATGQ